MSELTAIQLAVLIAAVGVVAFIYSSVGHGGATGYLAVMSLLGINASFSRPGALWLNCLVASLAFWRFRKAGFFSWNVFLPLAVASIPMAWIGGWLHLEGRAAAVLLGIALVGAGWFLGWGRRDVEERPNRPVATPLALLVGGVLGFLAGITGIGGGVFLTPLLICLNWTPAKTAGGISALFILVNSVSGLTGLGSEGLIWRPVFVFAIAAGAAGALFGTHLGVNRWRTTSFRRALGVVLWIAAGKLLLTGK